MRTTLDLDETLVRELLQRHPGVSKTRAIEEAVRGYLKGQSVEGIRRLAGTLEIEDVSDEFRRADRRG
ncbi:MAG: type II toxin-antitoxin system VapB family antitoxin [Chloroflexota bacterium]